VPDGEVVIGSEINRKPMLSSLDLRSRDPIGAAVHQVEPGRYPARDQQRGVEVVVPGGELGRERCETLDDPPDQLRSASS
jgi:hypothetical protein